LNGKLKMRLKEYEAHETAGELGKTLLRIIESIHELDDNLAWAMDQISDVKDSIKDIEKSLEKAVFHD